MPSGQVEMSNNQEDIKNDTESELRMQNISEFSNEGNDLVSDNATAAVGVIGLGLASSQIDVHSAFNKSRDHRHKLADLDSHDAASDEMYD